MSEEEHIIMENSVNEDVDKGIELSILFRMALTKQSFRISSRARVKGSDFLTAAPSFLKTMKNATQRANFGGSLRHQHAVDITRNLCRRHPRWGKRVAAVSASSKWAQRLL
jgi:hypothetical protein